MQARLDSHRSDDDDLDDLNSVIMNQLTEQQAPISSEQLAPGIDNFGSSDVNLSLVEDDSTDELFTGYINLLSPNDQVTPIATTSNSTMTTTITPVPTTSNINQLQEQQQTSSPPVIQSNITQEESVNNEPQTEDISLMSDVEEAVPIDDSDDDEDLFTNMPLDGQPLSSLIREGNFCFSFRFL